MAGIKEIRTKIKSVQNTSKITKAMEMVAASKMRKAQDRMRAARPYADKVRNIAAHMSQANPDYSHPYLAAQNEIKGVGMIVVTTDKGLCGGLNTNVLRAVLNKIKEYEALPGRIYDLEFNADGSRFVVGSSLNGTGEVRVYETDSGKLLAKMDGQKGAIYAVAFSRGGSVVASAGFDGVVRLNDATTGALVKEFTPVPEGATVVANR